MMFIMIANIEGNTIENTIVGVSFESFAKHVMFRNEMSSNRVSS